MSFEPVPKMDKVTKKVTNVVYRGKNRAQLDYFWLKLYTDKNTAKINPYK